MKIHAINNKKASGVYIIEQEHKGGKTKVELLKDFITSKIKTINPQ